MNEISKLTSSEAKHQKLQRKKWKRQRTSLGYHIIPDVCTLNAVFYCHSTLT